MFLTTVEIPDISVDIKSIKQMLDGFDPVSLLPGIDTLVGKVQLVCVIALLAGPLIMTGMGLVYLLFATWDFGWGFDKYIAEVNKGAGVKLSPKLKPYFQWVLPILIVIILLQGLL